MRLMQLQRVPLAAAIAVFGLVLVAAGVRAEVHLALASDDTGADGADGADGPTRTDEKASNPFAWLLFKKAAKKAAKKVAGKGVAPFVGPVIRAVQDAGEGELTTKEVVKSGATVLVTTTAGPVAGLVTDLALNNCDASGQAPVPWWMPLILGALLWRRRAAELHAQPT